MEEARTVKEAGVIKTYQDLLECGEDESARISFIRGAINDHKSSKLYQTAVDAQLYYEGENPTINRYEKILYDMQGKAHRDMYTANHKIASQFFRVAVKQEYSYLLGNGVTFKGDVKKNLGRTFDQQVSRAAEYALIGGVSFGFWNLDHVDVFEITEFVPLEDEENGALAAGIRFWQVDSSRPLRCTLYEMDGYTEYIQRSGEDMTIFREKRPYKIHVTETELDSTRIYNGENYPAFPIVPLKNNRKCRSELCGKRNTIDALDLAKSNMVNNVDEANIIYWVLTNAGGMDDLDASKFLERVRTMHVAWNENGDEGATAEPRSIEAPYDGTKTTIDMLIETLYDDFMAFNPHAVQAGNQTATAINASYTDLDLKTDDFERQVTEFIQGILVLAGIEDEPTYTRNKLINKMEEMQTLLMASEYLDAEYITTKALTIMGDADMVEEVLKRQAEEDLEKFDAADSNAEEIPGADESIDSAEAATGKTGTGRQDSDHFHRREPGRSTGDHPR